MVYVPPQDRVRESSTTTGTSALTLTATSDYRRFSDVAAVNDTMDYAIILGSAWEVGVGTLGPGNTLARTTVTFSSNGGAPVSFAAGVKDVFNDAAAHVLNAMVRADVAQAFSNAQKNQARDNIGYAGDVVQSVFASYGTLADLTVAIPADDTSPQISEGTEIISVSFTLKKATNKVRYRFQGQGSANPGDVIMAAMFNGATNALAGVMINSGSSSRHMLAFEGEHTPGSVGPFTYSIRVGSSTGASNPMRMNGNSGGRYFNGVAQTTLVLEEIAV